ncbi:hypothetical protein LJB42_004455 [Komagataella kurtzmanii]|nr:hypothetical protein LJB42_004455 [Komagataella kurtzmanii]
MHFKDRIVDTQVGFANGNVANPTYTQICLGMTHHAEVLQISYNPDSTTQLRKIAKVMNDIGSQYRSVVFYLDEKEKEITEQSLAEAQKKWFPHHKIVTQVEKLTSYLDADDYHQDYLMKNPNGYHCPTHVLRKEPKSMSI